MFKENLQRAIEERGLTQKQLSDLSGVSRAGISQYLSGRGEPKPRITALLAAALNIEPEYLTSEAAPAAIPTDETFEESRRLSVPEAARILNMHPPLLRRELLSGKSRFGFAVAPKTPGGRCAYHISAKQVYTYMGTSNG